MTQLEVEIIRWHLSTGLGTALPITLVVLYVMCVAINSLIRYASTTKELRSCDREWFMGIGIIIILVVFGIVLTSLSGAVYNGVKAYVAPMYLLDDLKKER